MQPEDNDIVYSNYAPDFLGMFRKIAEAILGSDTSLDGVTAWLLSVWTIYSFLALLASALFIFGIIYSYIRIGQLSEIEAQNIEDAERTWRDLHGQSQENRRMAELQKHVASGNPNDWKLSIIEADIILGEVLDAAGYTGLTIGDKLKGASASNFATLQDAWDAHLIRNKIAHQGADFVLTQTTAKATMIKYQRVFKEFNLV